LRGAALTGANLQNARLTGADLTGADLQGADLTGAVLTRVVLKNTKLTAAILSKTRMIGVDLRGVQLAGNQMNDADLRSADLSGADLSGINLTNASLGAATLINTNLSGATLVHADLSGAQMEGVRLSGANLLNALLYGSNLQTADLSGANLRGADLSGTKMNQADLSRAFLADAFLGGAVLTGADFSHAILAGIDKTGKKEIWLAARLDGASLGDTIWEGAYAAGASFNGADLRGANLSGAILRDTLEINGQWTDLAVSLSATSMDPQSSWPTGFDPNAPAATRTPTSTPTFTPAPPTRPPTATATGTATATPTATITPTPTPAVPLAGYWAFDEGTDSLTYDSSGHNNTGILVNSPTWEERSLAPVAGNRWALQFDGLNRSVSITDSVSLRPESLTIAGWFRWLSTPFTSQMLVAKPVGADVYDSYQLFYNMDGRQLEGSVGAAAASGDRVVYRWTPDAGAWYHLAFTFDNSSKMQALYINGVPVALQSAGVDFKIGYDDRALQIGRDSNYGAWTTFFIGQVDEVNLYYRALTETEIAALAGVSRPWGLRASAPTVTPVWTPTMTPTATLTAAR
jgi:uncharacterized protein YjbI with pentapeptide repeats